MRENRTHGSEGGEGESPFRPLSVFAQSRKPAARPVYCSVRIMRSLRITSDKTRLPPQLFLRQAKRVYTAVGQLSEEDDSRHSGQASRCA